MACCAIPKAKKILFVLNILLAVFAVGIIILGFWLLADNDWKTYDEIAFVFVSGLFLFIISLLGFNGSRNEHNCMLITYAILSIILCILLIPVVLVLLYGVVHPRSVKHMSSEIVAEIFVHYYTSTDSKLEMDDIQRTFQCCGVNGPSDYNNVIPASCCDNNNYCNSLNPSLFLAGCEDFQFYYLALCIKIALVAVLILCPLLIIGITAGCSLKNSLRNQFRRQNYV